MMQKFGQRRCLFAVLALFTLSANSGFYVTGSVGGGETTAAWDIDASATFVAIEPVFGDVAFTTIPYQNNSDEDTEVGVGQLGLGYGMRFKQYFFVGVEASVAGNLPEPVIEDQVELNEVYELEGGTPITAELATDTKLSVLDPDVNVDLKLGVYVTPYSLVYAKGGVVFNKLELESTTSYFYENTDVHSGTPKNFTSIITDNKQQDVTGLHLALGIEHLITPQLAFNMEYVYVNYGDISISTVAPTTSTPINTPPTEIADGLQNDTSVNVVKQSVMLGLVWYFGKQYQDNNVNQ